MQGTGSPPTVGDVATTYGFFMGGGPGGLSGFAAPVQLLPRILVFPCIPSR